MKFVLFGGNWYSEWPVVRRAVSEAEDLGFWGFLMPDHYVTGDGRAGYSTLDAWVALSYLAPATERLKLGTLVTPIPFRPPGMLAKIVSTLDVLSSGRVVLGVGAGWSRVEFEAYSEWADARTRVEMTEEGLQLMLRLWQEDRVDFKGRYYKAKDAVLEPKPVQKPHPPLLFGGSGPRMLRMAGRYGDICYIAPWTNVSYREARGIVETEASKAKRGGEVSFASGSPSPLGPKYDSAEYAGRVEEAVKNGCDHFILALPMKEKVFFESMRDFARNIMPSFVN